MANELVQIQPGTQVERWMVDKKLGEGGFGAVYLVSDATGKYALKVEGVNEQIQVSFIYSSAWTISYFFRF